MTLPLNLNYLDVLILAILVLFILRGVFQGFLSEVAGLVGLVGGVMLAGKFYGALGQQLSAYIHDSSWPYVIAYVLILAGAMLIAGLIARMLHKLLSVVYADWLNHLAGAATGGLKGFLICAVLVGLLNNFLGEAPFVRQSRMVPPIVQMTTFLKGFLPQTIQLFL